jgi:hypothetical protein
MIDEPSNEYLWDRTGEPDTYVEHLETVLKRYRFDQPIRVARGVSTLRWIWHIAGIATAAVILFAAYVALIPVFGQPGREWQVIARGGRPIVSGREIAESGTLAAGGSVETDAESRAEIRAGRVGRIDVQPGSRLRLVSTAGGRHRLALDRGRIAARLWSPPFTFGFATPAAEAFDVGCAFTMDVDARGTATVRVTSGWVQLETPERQELIPEGAVAVAETGKRIGTPFFDDASVGFKRALHAFDADALTGAERSDVLATLLNEARRQDAYTLLRLARDLTPSERGALYDRVAVLRPPPSGVTRNGIMASNGAMLEAWRRTLGFAEVKHWWLHWTDALEF